MTDFEDLAKHCERADEPDRSIDGMIAEAVGATMPDDPAGWPPRYTASMEAAMTLRPQGWSYQLKTAEHHENGFQFECWVSWGPIAYQRIKAQAVTEATAISAGWLRAANRGEA